MNCEEVQPGENQQGKMFLEDLEGRELCLDAAENRVSYTIMAFVIRKEDGLSRSIAWMVLGDMFLRKGSSEGQRKGTPESQTQGHKVWI